MINPADSLTKKIADHALAFIFWNPRINISILLYQWNKKSFSQDYCSRFINRKNVDRALTEIFWDQWRNLLGTMNTSFGIHELTEVVLYPWINKKTDPNAAWS